MKTSKITKTKTLKQVKSKDEDMYDYDLISNDPKKYAEGITVKELVELLKSLSNEYYNTSVSPVSDETFDTLKEILEVRDPTNEFLFSVGAPVNKNQVELPYPMSSLDKIKPEKNNLDGWLKKYKGPYLLSDKLDGVSGQYYKDEEGNNFLFTRGDGKYGTEITHLIKHVLPKFKFDAVPLGTSVRGELIISRTNFKTIADKMKNARNTVSGLVNSKTVDIKIAKLCEFVAYAIIYPEYKQSEQMKLLKKYGFKVVTHKIQNEINFENLSEYLITRRKDSEYDIDGIVVVDDSDIYSAKNINPEHAFAFKTVLQDQIAIATVKNIHWEASMDGYLKPTIEIEPIDLGGVTIKRATAFNGKYIVDNSLGPGAKIKIVRSGDVIPYILEVITAAENPQMPDVAYKWNKTGVDIVLKDIHGAQADNVSIKLLTNFFVKMGIESMGEGTITKLVNAGFKTIPDVLSAFRNQKKKLEELEGLGNKVITKIWTNIKTVLSNTKLETLMAASHMFGRGFGEKRITEILAIYPNIMELAKEWSIDEMKNKISNIKGFSDITAIQFSENFQNFMKLYNEINKIIDISYLEKNEDDDIDDDVDKIKHDLIGKTFVFTGFRDKELKEKIISRGGKVSESVTSSTTYVVCLDTNTERTGKIADADKKKIPVIKKSEFISKFKLQE